MKNYLGGWLRGEKTKIESGVSADIPEKNLPPKKLKQIGLTRDKGHNYIYEYVLGEDEDPLNLDFSNATVALQIGDFIMIGPDFYRVYFTDNGSVRKTVLAKVNYDPRRR